MKMTAVWRQRLKRGKMESRRQDWITGSGYRGRRGGGQGGEGGMGKGRIGDSTRRKKEWRERNGKKGAV